MKKADDEMRLASVSSKRRVLIAWGLACGLALGTTGCHYPHYGVQLRNHASFPVLVYGEDRKGRDSSHVVGAGKTGFVFLGQSADGKPSGVTIVVSDAQSGRELARLPVEERRAEGSTIDWLVEYRPTRPTSSK